MTNAPRPELVDSSLTAIPHAERGSCCALTGELLAKCLTSYLNTKVRVQGRMGLGLFRPEGGRPRSALAREGRHGPVQSHHQARASRPDSAGSENGSPDRLLGAEPDDAARHAGVATPRLKAFPATAPCPPSEVRTKAEQYHT